MEQARDATGTGHRPRVAVESGDGELRLVVDGAVQSVAVGTATPHGYWPALLPGRRPCTALILGLGGGTVAHLLLRRWHDVAITAVDDDPAVLDLARTRFGLDGLGLTIVESDARAFVRGCAGRFDLVIVDLYRGEVAADFLGSGAFIRSVRQLVTPGGTAVWNLHRDRRGARLRRQVGHSMVLDRRVLVGLNLVLHFRRRRRVLHLSLPAR